MSVIREVNQGFIICYSNQPGTWQSSVLADDAQINILYAYASSPQQLADETATKIFPTHQAAAEWANGIREDSDGFAYLVKVTTKGEASQINRGVWEAEESAHRGDLPRWVPTSFGAAVGGYVLVTEGVQHGYIAAAKKLSDEEAALWMAENSSVPASIGFTEAYSIPWAQQA